jgi:hypothetical protein
MPSVAAQLETWASFFLERRVHANIICRFYYPGTIRPMKSAYQAGNRVLKSYFHKSALSQIVMLVLGLCKIISSNIDDDMGGAIV